MWIVIALVTQVAAQEEPPPPPVVPLETAPQDPYAPPPPPPPPQQPAPPRQPPAPDPKRAGIEQPVLGLIQVGVGVGACCAGCCVSIVPGLGLSLVPVVGGIASAFVSDLIIGGAIGLAEGWVGDALGQDRAPLVWPIATSVGFLLAGTAVTTVVNIIAPAPLPTPGQPQDPAELQRALLSSPLRVGAGLFSLGTCVGAIVAPAIVYAMTSVPKKPGDTGQGFPGLMAPADPAPARAAVMQDAPAAVAMAY